MYISSRLVGPTFLHKIFKISLLSCRNPSVVVEFTDERHARVQGAGLLNADSEACL
jgi:hypothetical protein